MVPVGHENRSMVAISTSSSTCWRAHGPLSFPFQAFPPLALWDEGRIDRIEIAVLLTRPQLAHIDRFPVAPPDLGAPHVDGEELAPGDVAPVGCFPKRASFVNLILTPTRRRPPPWSEWITVARLHAVVEGGRSCRVLAVLSLRCRSCVSLILERPLSRRDRYAPRWPPQKLRAGAHAPAKGSGSIGYAGMR